CHAGVCKILELFCCFFEVDVFVLSCDTCQLGSAVEFFLYFCGWGLGHQGDNNGDNQVGEESWNHLVDDVRGCRNHAPGHGHYGTGDHTRDSAGRVETLPVQREQNQWAECGTEAGPGKADQT